MLILLKPFRRPPHGGADRNNPSGAYQALAVDVAPRTGARIETMKSCMPSATRRCRPPHGGADRNPYQQTGWLANITSPPARGRGSKQPERRVSGAGSGSPPARGRGSKLDPDLRGGGQVGRPPHGGADRNGFNLYARRWELVAPRTGARIETRARSCTHTRTSGRPPHGGADRNKVSETPDHNLKCRPPHGGADRNNMVPFDYTPEKRRPPHGGADRNSAPCNAAIGWRPVAPRTGARIETGALRVTAG